MDQSRVRFHEQLGVTKEEIRTLLDGRLVPLPEIATAQGDMIFEAALMPETMSTSSAFMGEHVTSPAASGNTVEKAEDTEAADDQKATSTTWLETKVEEAPDWTSLEGEAEPQTPPLTPFTETAAGEQAPVTPPLYQVGGKQWMSASNNFGQCMLRFSLCDA